MALQVQVGFAAVARVAALGDPLADRYDLSGMYPDGAATQVGESDIGTVGPIDDDVVAEDAVGPEQFAEQFDREHVSQAERAGAGAVVAFAVVDAHDRTGTRRLHRSAEAREVPRGPGDRPPSEFGTRAVQRVADEIDRIRLSVTLDAVAGHSAGRAVEGAPPPAYRWLQFDRRPVQRADAQQRADQDHRDSPSDEEGPGDKAEPGIGQQGDDDRRQDCGAKPGQRCGDGARHRISLSASDTDGWCGHRPCHNWSIGSFRARRRCRAARFQTSAMLNACKEPSSWAEFGLTGLEVVVGHDRFVRWTTYERARS